MIASYSWKLVARNPRRSFTFVFGLALAVGLFSGILFFIDTMTRGMTEKALAPVALDMVAHTTRADADISTMAPRLATLRGINAAEPVISADFASATKAGSGIVIPTGRLFAVPASYLNTFNLVRLSEGAFRADGVVISETMAVAQKLKLGDSLQMNFIGVDKPVELPISGIANLENADALFSTANEAENALVADVVFVDLRWFQKNLLAPLTKLALDPATVLAPGSIALDKQIHLKLDRRALPDDPTATAIQADALRRGVERQFPGDLKAVDNIAGALKAAKSDVLSAKILFVFLGLPGVLLAAYLSKFAAEIFAEARRREISLLRTRGAKPRQIGGIVALSSLWLSLIGSIIGLVLGIGLVLLTGAASPTTLLSGSGFLGSATISFVAGLLLTFVAGFLPSFNAMRQEVLEDRKVVNRQGTVPFWKKAWLDVLFLVISAIVLVITQMNGGFKPTGNEGQAVELSFYIFLAPLLAWIGMTLLVMRVAEALLRRKNSPLPGLFRALMGGVGEMAAKSMPRRSRTLSSATTVIALTLSFGISLIVFQATYSNEKRLDSQYIVGSDIRVTPALNAPQRQDFINQLKRPGVVSITGVVRDTQALIGMEKNTVYGIDVASFRTSAYLPDSFFVDGASAQTLAALRDKTTAYAPGRADQVLNDLAATPNGVIISVEQAQKYNIQLGDPVMIKLYNRLTKEYKPVEAKAVGFFIYFPTSSQDSDFILNRDFMTAISGNPNLDNFLIKVGKNPALIGSVAESIAMQFKHALPLRITTTDSVIKTDSSSLTSLNLGGLGLLELLYTILVATIGLGVFLNASVNERKREFGTMRAFGADLGHLRKVLFAESLTIAVLSVLMGVAVGLLLAGLFILLLGVIFTIPPHGLDLPLPQMAGLLALVIAGMVISTLSSASSLGKIKVVEALREL